LRQSLEKTADLLREQIELLADITKLSHEMRTVMVSADMSPFNDLVRQERAAISKMNATQRELVSLLPVVSAELGLGDIEATLGDIINHAKPEEHSVILPLQRTLKKELNEFLELSNATREVVDLHLECSEILMNFAASEEDPLNNFYGGDGNAAPERMKAGIFDSKA
jgi:hypothetical protein